MTKTTTLQGEILYQCKCLLSVTGGPEDTLMAEEYFLAGESNLKHEAFIETSAFDAARHIVKRDCPNCGLDFMTMILVGQSLTAMFTCTCGYQTQ